MVKSGCFFPWYKKGEKQPIPCGKCPLCRKRNLNGWAFRAKQQLHYADSAKFITLTYDDSNLVFTKKSGLMALSRRHVQLFFKRLRKAHEPKRKVLRATASGRILQLSGKRVQGKTIQPDIKPIKYLAVGEYGGRTFRPHYHLLLFNCKTELIQDAWKNPLTGQHMGSIDYGDKRGVSDASTAYVLAYLGKPSTVGKEKWDDRPKEFKLISKGFGAQYLNDEQRTWHLNDLPNRMYCVTHGGKKISMPRYYKNKIYNQLQKDEAFAVQTQKLIEQQLEELYRKDAKKLLSERRSWKEQMKGSYRKMYLSNLKSKI